MELDWARNQPQETRGIEPRKNIRGEDTYEEKTTWLAWGTRLARG
jgi:hypothetical protein